METFQEFKEFFLSEGHPYEEFDARIDLNELINYLILEILFNNTDWPNNNLVLWRPQDEGGKWRFIVKDVDFTTGIYSANAYDSPTLYNLTDPAYGDKALTWPMRVELFKKLLAMEEFSNPFIDRFCLYLASYLCSENINQVLDDIVNTIYSSLPRHLEKYGYSDLATYDSRHQAAKEWIRKRVDFMYTHLQDFFTLGALTEFEIRENGLLGNLIINGEPVSTSHLSGKWYCGRQIKVAVENPQKHDLQWKVEAYSYTGENPANLSLHGTESTTETIYKADELNFILPTCDRLVITPIVTDDISVDSILLPVSTPIRIYDTMGRELNQLPAQGVYIVTPADGKPTKHIR